MNIVQDFALILALIINREIIPTTAKNAPPTKATFQYPVVISRITANKTTPIYSACLIISYLAL